MLLLVCSFCGFFLVFVGSSDFYGVYLHPATITITDLLLILHTSSQASFVSYFANNNFEYHVHCVLLYMLLVSIKFTMTLVLNCNAM